MKGGHEPPPCAKTKNKACDCQEEDGAACGRQQQHDAQTNQRPNKREEELVGWHSRPQHEDRTTVVATTTTKQQVSRRVLLSGRSTVEVDGLHFDFRKWHSLHRKLQGKERHRDIAFVGLGAHSTYIDHTCSVCWESMPSFWTHGRTFQPLLDHLCEQSGADLSTASWSQVVWTTMNSQCAEKKTSYKWQATLARAANDATRDAAKALGVPLLDWASMFHSSEDVCDASGDGIHVQHWVDHVRAQLLLSYLCTDENAYRGFSPSVSIDSSRARCACDRQRSCWRNDYNFSIAEPHTFPFSKDLRKPRSVCRERTSMCEVG